ncbi:MAG TPA: hypothetical protein VGF55_29200 [Gemmataceae bacterium]|jgi:hypothetical protein
MAGQEGLGRLFNFVHQASGVHIPLDNASGITFFNFLDAGTQSVTLKESIDGASEQNLAVIDKLYKGPGIGGTWTKVTQAAAATYDNSTDATNDCIAIYVGADQLSDGFNCVELTSGTGTCIAVIHDLNVQRDPANLASSVV